MPRNFYTRILRPTLALVAFVFMAGPLLPEDLSDWGKQLPAKQRFVVLSDFNDRAVLDKETQLVWERFPGDVNGDGLLEDSDDVSADKAAFFCVNKNVGGRKGWRLPAVNELASLLDPSNAPSLPPGHPFVFCTGRCKLGLLVFWTNTIPKGAPTFRWLVDFSNSAFHEGDIVVVPADFLAKAWCVRAPIAGPDSY